MNEAEWMRNKTVPTIEQYMENGFVSFALGPIILPALYVVGPKLSEEAIADPECHEMFRLVSTCGRLLNDLQGYEVIHSVSTKFCNTNRLEEANSRPCKA